MSRFKLSVIIVTYNRRSYLEKCLKSIFNMEEKPYEVIVVDNCSPDGTDKISKIFPVKFFCIKSSMVEARNIGLEHATGDIVAYVDDDTTLCKDWSIKILESYKDELIGGVGGRVVNILDGDAAMDGFSVPTTKPVEVNRIRGCNMSFRRAVLNTIGGFDECFMGSCFREERDLCFRVRKLGFKLVYHPKAIVYHNFGSRVLDGRQIYWITYNNVYYYLKNFGFAGIFGFLRDGLSLNRIRTSDIKIRITPSSISYIIKGTLEAIKVRTTHVS